jgi:hypothetical protein
MFKPDDIFSYLQEWQGDLMDRNFETKEYWEDQND